MKRTISSVIAAAILATQFSGCASNTTGQNLAIAAAVIGGVALARKGAFNGGGGTSTVDYEYDWDLIRNQYGQPVWMCRGVQTGEFADMRYCSGKPMTDSRWPGY